MSIKKRSSSRNAEHVDGAAFGKDAADLHRALGFQIAFGQRGQSGLYFADADGHLADSLLHQRFFHGLRELVQLVDAVDAVHILDQHGDVAVHLHQRVGFRQGDQLAKRRVSAEFVGVLHLEQQHAAFHLQRNLVLARARHQRRADDILPEDPAEHVGLAGDGEARLKHAHQHRVGKRQQVIRAFGAASQVRNSWGFKSSAR